MLLHPSTTAKVRSWQVKMADWKRWMDSYRNLSIHIQKGKKNCNSTLQNAKLVNYIYDITLFLWWRSIHLEFDPESEPIILSPTSLLQRGQEALIFSHLSTHSLWKKCEQGSSLSSSLFAYFAKQMQQTCHSYNLMSILNKTTHEYACEINKGTEKLELQNKWPGHASGSSYRIFSRDHSLMLCSSSHNSTINSTWVAISIITVPVFTHLKLVCWQGINGFCCGSSCLPQVLSKP